MSATIDKKQFIFDGHLDLATNAMALNRDLTKSVEEIRKKERDLNWNDFQDRGKGTVALPELREGNVGLVLATIISRYSDFGDPLETLALSGWHSPSQAYANAQAQLMWYREMERQGEMFQVTDKTTLNKHLKLWSETSETVKRPIGYILALEGGDSIVTLDHLHSYYSQGLRSIGISHFGPGRYAAGTHSDGSGLTALGKELLKEMNGMNIMLDLTHLTDKGFFEALKIFTGEVIASHQNCRSLISGERQFSDDQIRCILERDGIIGGALDTWMLYEGFRLNKDNPKTLQISIARLVDHFDHICQMAGDASHIAIGSDLDGLFGLEQTPFELETIADLQKFGPLLLSRGYCGEDIKKIFSENWIRQFYKIL